MLASRHPPFSPGEGVDGHVDGQDDKTEHHLDARREAGRIDERNKVMLDEASVVACGTRRAPKRVFERRQRTDGSAELGERAPRHGRQVDRSPDPATQHERAADEHEHDEREVEDENGIGREAENHGAGSARRGVVNARAHLDP